MGDDPFSSSLRLLRGHIRHADQHNRNLEKNAMWRAHLKDEEQRGNRSPSPSSSRHQSKRGHRDSSTRRHAKRKRTRSHSNERSLSRERTNRSHERGRERRKKSRSRSRERKPKSRSPLREKKRKAKKKAKSLTTIDFEAERRKHEIQRLRDKIARPKDQDSLADRVAAHLAAVYPSGRLIPLTKSVADDDWKNDAFFDLNPQSD